ncbi:MAG: hypothetical protein RL375_2686 [Pseudomonadota bacterium]|jgi:hypothetical protein
MPRAFAMWSPHRDSREVMLWKSLLGFRPEPWHWVDELDSARWYVVDVARGVAPELTAELDRQASQRGVRGVALARQWTDLPAPCWTFFKVPLQLAGVSRWLDQIHPVGPVLTTGRLDRAAHVQAANSSFGGMPARPAGTDAAITISWQGQLLRLTRWPDVNRYANGSMELTIACARLLREWVPYEVIVASVHNQLALRSLLSDAQLNGSLRCTPVGQVSPFRRPADGSAARSHLAESQALTNNGATGAATSAAAWLDEVPVEAMDSSADKRRWGLLRRLWSRFA